MEKQHLLNRIKVSGYKSIREMDLPLRELNILIGPNGAGKSNFIGLFKFIRHLVEERLQYYVNSKGGAEKFLHYGSKNPPSLLVFLTFEPNYYGFQLSAAAGDRLIFENERWAFDTTYLFKEGKNLNINESDLPEYNRQNSYGIGKYVYQVLKSWRVYHFHDTGDSALVKKKGKISDVDYLREDASNLAAFLLHLKQESPLHYQRIVKVARQVIPFFRDFYLRPVPGDNDSILLEWLDVQSDMIFTADDLSDGSLRFLCLATLLLQPKLPKLILLDEPELGLHPTAIAVLAGLLQSAAARTQIIAATQSDRLLSKMEPEDVIVVERKDGASVFRRLQREDLGSWLDEYNLGELWNQNVFGGRP